MQALHSLNLDHELILNQEVDAQCSAHALASIVQTDGMLLLDAKAGGFDLDHQAIPIDGLEEPGPSALCTAIAHPMTCSRRASRAGRSTFMSKGRRTKGSMRNL